MSTSSRCRGDPTAYSVFSNRCTCVMRKTSIVATGGRGICGKDDFSPVRSTMCTCGACCLRYVERNPVRAGIVQRAEDYPWSSAAFHCGQQSNPVVTTNSAHWEVFERITAWSDWLAEEDEHLRVEIVRRNIYKNLPCGSDAFVERLERISKRSLRFRPVGRPPSSEKG